MRSIPTIFCYDKETHMVSNKQLHIVEWVFQGKGQATRKYDGVAIKVEGSKVFRRHEWREGEQAPQGFIRCEDPNPKRPYAPLPGWVPVSDTFLTSPKGRDERALKEAWNEMLTDLTKIAFNNKKEPKVVNQYAPTPIEHAPEIPDGTYELCGPDIHDNNEKFKKHVLFRHGADLVSSVPRTFEKLKKFLETYDGEGIVWHYKFGNTILMAKIKRSDFGFRVRSSKEDLAMAYRKEEPAKEPAVVTTQEIQESGFASVFEADNSITGDDIHLEKEKTNDVDTLDNSASGS